MYWYFQTSQMLNLKFNLLYMYLPMLRIMCESVLHKYCMDIEIGAAFVAPHENKVNLRDLIAGTSLVILLKLDSNRWFFSLFELEIWWITSKNYGAPLLHYIKLCASSQTPWWNQTQVTVQKCSILVNTSNFLSCVTLKFDGWPWKTIRLHQASCIISS